MFAEAYSADFYDAYFVGLEGDVEFYVEEAGRCGSPVLELGCGSGRVALPTAAAGIDIVGLDRSQELLALAGRKQVDRRDRAAFVRADMTDFALRQQFNLVTIPYRTFQHLIAVADQGQALRRIHSHLADDGWLIFDTFDPSQDLVAEGWRSGLRKDTDFIHPTTGNRVLVWYDREYDPQLQLIEQELVFEELADSGATLSRSCRRLTLRCTPRWEMEYLLERNGFYLEALYGDFEGGEFPGFGEQIWVARKIGLQGQNSRALA